MKPHFRLSPLVGLLLVLTATIVIYLPAFHYDFTNWDDGIYVTNNPLIQHFSAASVGQLFRPNSKYMYHPLTMVTYAFDWLAGNGSAGSFHATSIILHLLNVILLFFLLRRIIDSDTVILFCVAVFALHPLQIESVVWISGRKEVLYSFFYLISLLFYTAWDKKRSIYFYLSSLLFFVCSLLSKPTAVTLPLVILAFEWFRSGKISMKTVLRLAPFFLGAAAFTLASMALQYTAAPVDNYSIPQRTLFIAYQLFFYPWKAVVPAKLSACYAYPQLANGSLPLEYYIAPVFLVLSIGLLWMVRKKSRDIFWGPVVYFLTLSPVLQLIPFNNASLVADRYAYLPIIGLAFLFSQLAGMAAEAISHLSVTLPDLKKVILSLAAFALIVPSVQRIHVWENGLTLFDDVIQKNDRIGIAYGNRADAKLKNGDFAAALADCNQLVALRPNDGLAFYDRGNALSGLHRYRDAVENFTHAIGLGFSNSSVYYNRGIAYYNLGTVDSAVSDFHTSRSFDAHFADAPYSLGYAALYSSGNARDAAAYFDTALAINPEYAEASYQKAHAEYDIRLYGNAMEDLSNAISARPELKNDPLVSDVNRAIDSINAVISKIKALQPKSAESIESRNHLHELYVMLGDSLRAHEIPGSPKARSDERDRR